MSCIRTSCRSCRCAAQCNLLPPLFCVSCARVDLRCMPMLDDLRVSKNPDLVSLPAFFTGFPRLVEFYAFNCKIEELPEELAHCKLLVKIMVASNRLTRLPEAVARSAVRPAESRRDQQHLSAAHFTQYNRFYPLSTSATTSFQRCLPGSQKRWI